jgi:hypothetical protein
MQSSPGRFYRTFAAEATPGPVQLGIYGGFLDWLAGGLLFNQHRHSTHRHAGYIANGDNGDQDMEKEVKFGLHAASSWVTPSASTV